MLVCSASSSAGLCVESDGDPDQADGTAAAEALQESRAGIAAAPPKSSGRNSGEGSAGPPLLYQIVAHPVGGGGGAGEDGGVGGIALR